MLYGALAAFFVWLPSRSFMLPPWAVPVVVPVAIGVLAIVGVVGLAASALTVKLSDDIGKMDVHSDAFSDEWQAEINRDIVETRENLRVETVYSAILAIAGTSTFIPMARDVAKAHPIMILAVAVGLFVMSGLILSRYLRAASAVDTYRQELDAEKRKAKAFVDGISERAKRAETLSSAFQDRGWPYSGKPRVVAVGSGESVA